MLCLNKNHFKYVSCVGLFLSILKVLFRNIAVYIKIFKSFIGFILRNFEKLLHVSLRTFPSFQRNICLHESILSWGVFSFGQLTYTEK